MAVAELAAVEDMMIIATCSLTITGSQYACPAHRKVSCGNVLLNGPGFSHLKIPLSGINICMAFPNQYDKTSKNRVDTDNVCGLK